MSSIQFGNTWWGEKWLDALLQTDYSNRLPRGKSYARNGYVKSLEIDINNGVLAHVAGSRRTPYKIKLKLSIFTAEQKKQILNIITQNPHYLSQLLIRKLPNELLNECKNVKINLFPQKWKDIKASCSCPDWADCCKHIAAVIYMIANEIDKNPFLVFNLHGFDILKDLEKKGFKASKASKCNIEQISNWLVKITNKKNPKKTADKNCHTNPIKIIEQIDYSLIPHLQNNLLSLLTPNPVFYPRMDFKEILQKAYKIFAKQSEQIIREIQIKQFDQNNETVKEEIMKNIQLKLKSNLQFQELHLSTLNQEYYAKNQQEFYRLITEKIITLPWKKIHSQDHKAIFLYATSYFVLELLIKGAYLPQIFSTDQKRYFIRFIPALLNEKTQEIFDLLLQIFPDDLIKTPILKKDEALKTICASIFSTFIDNFANNNRELSNHEISLNFFHGAEIKTDSYDNKEIPHNIALWLERFYITQKDFRPVLKITENNSGFDIEILAENKKNALKEPIKLAKVFQEKKYEQIKMTLMKDLTLLTEQFPELEKVIASQGTKKIQFSQREFAPIFFEKLPILKLLAIPILFPKGLQDLIIPKISPAISKKSSTVLKSYISLNDLLEFDWKIALGDQFISPAEFKKLIKNASGIIKIKEQFVYLDEMEIQKLLKNLDTKHHLTREEMLKTILAEEYKGAKIHLDKEVQKTIQELLNTREITLPQNLQANLRDYQKRGFDWLYKNLSLGFGSLIADDMGLGKTIQVIAILLKLKSEKRLDKCPALVVVPTTLLTNWMLEIQKFAPDLRTHIYHGAQRKIETKNIDVFISTYGLVRTDNEKFSKIKWASVIIDEAQNIKNTTTAQTKAIKSLKSDIRIAMTGTPVENRLSEYYSIFDFLNKGYFKNLKNFQEEFARPIELERNHKQLEIFQKITSPFIIRRLKSDKSIIKDLPEKMEMNQFCSLTGEQTALYESVTREAIKMIENSEGIERKGLVLKMITGLKQICNHPAQYLHKKNADPIHSGKVALLLELLKNIYDNEEKVLIFTQYTQMGDLLQKIIADELGSTPLFLYGGLTRKKRDEMVDNFQNEPFINTMILSLKAGGTGLNLTAAQSVIHFDLWWNPAVEAQATDRAYRIGQKNNVMVHRLITKGTFEEKIDQMIRDKKELANLAVTTGEKWIGEFSDQDLRKVFELR